jgi:methyl-accepting chemotaxis protein
VVAGDVRKLAERSRLAAQEIGALAGNSVQLAEKAGALLGAVVPTIVTTSDLFQGVAAASREQSEGVSQINSAMGVLSQSTQENACSAEELAATASQLGAQAAHLENLVASFRVTPELTTA